ncbi:outer membrane lipoprotein carrier protein LolA [Saccharomonospora sp. NPDC046836]|uniref:LolA family protein n=1 Tax=Saccharomonospora sp. NPDC046836 TaxID=3156921 RepID=UPI0033CA4A1B
MNPKKRAVAVAVAGTAIGAAGLAVLAVPAGAGEAPQLPPVSAEALVKSVLEADVPALSGDVAIDNSLGLPSVPGMPVLGSESARVYYDGNNASRFAVQESNSELTVVHNGTTVWTYNSTDNSATKMTLPAAERHQLPENGQLADPASAATQLLDYIQQSSTVTVDGTARVADRPAYELVLTPKPTERTLLREVRIAVDSETRVPLRMSVHTNGTTEPALQIGFTRIDFAAQPADLFQFTPPQGARVTENQTKPGTHEQPPTDAESSIVGDGWDTVFVGRMPAGAPSGGEGDNVNVEALLQQMGRPVSGAFGSGYVIDTKVGTALVTSDGRVAFGAVPEQVLTQALEGK